jgi:rhamnosyltransferase
VKFCCGVTLYNPSSDEIHNILKYSDSFDCVYVYDNTKTMNLNQKYFDKKNSFVYLSNGFNDGLPVAYNIMCKKAIDDGFDFIALVDQDSLFLKKDIQIIKNGINNNDFKDIAIFAPTVVYVKSETKNFFRYSYDTKLKEVSWVISSGSFLKLSIYKKTFGFDEYYFIDRVDFDYCMTLKKQNYRILKFGNAYIYHRLGDNGSRTHNPLRHYYIFRNRMYYFLKKNRNAPFNYLFLFIKSLSHIARIIVFENNKFSKFKMLCIAIQDYKKFSEERHD